MSITLRYRAPSDLRDMYGVGMYRFQSDWGISDQRGNQPFCLMYVPLYLILPGKKGYEVLVQALTAERKSLPDIGVIIRVGVSLFASIAREDWTSVAISTKADRLFPNPIASAKSPPNGNGGLSFWDAFVIILRYARDLGYVRNCLSQ
jgi:hypothetical protein